MRTWRLVARQLDVAELFFVFSELVGPGDRLGAGGDGGAVGVDLVLLVGAPLLLFGALGAALGLLGLLFLLLRLAETLVDRRSRVSHGRYSLHPRRGW